MAFLVYADANLMVSNRSGRHKTHGSNSFLSHAPLVEMTNVLDLKSSCCLAHIILPLIPLKSTKHFRKKKKYKKCKISINCNIRESDRDDLF